MNELSIGNILGAIFIISFLAIIGIPMLSSVATPQAAAVYNGINQTNNKLLSQQIYQPLNSTVFSSQGFGASILNNLGFAFIFPEIFQFMQAIVRIPSVFVYDLQTTIQSTGISSVSAIATGAIITLILMYLSLYVIIQGVSGWNKYSYWNG